jgi:hypothetical protein
MSNDRFDLRHFLAVVAAVACAPLLKHLRAPIVRDALEMAGVYTLVRFTIDGVRRQPWRISPPAQYHLVGGFLLFMVGCGLAWLF